jgi:hypothetical protein
MKQGFLILFIACLLFTCKKQPIEHKFGYINTGDTVSENVYYSGTINFLLDCQDPKGHRTTVHFINLMNDNDSDFIFKSHFNGSSSGFYRELSIQTNSFNNHVSVNPNGWVVCHEAGEKMDKNLNWDSKDNFYFSRIFCYNEQEFHGTWRNAYDKYAGIMKIDGLDTIYGWIRLDVYEDSKILIKDFAYRK